MSRWVIHEENVDQIDTTPVMRDLAGSIATDARMLAEKGKTLGLSGGISVTEVSRTRAVVQSVARNPRSSPEHADYPYFVEKGTSRSRARPFMRPAAYRYRTP